MHARTGMKALTGYIGGFLDHKHPSDPVHQLEHLPEMSALELVDSENMESFALEAQVFAQKRVQQ